MPLALLVYPDTYTYYATGQKLLKVNVNGSNTVTTDYISGIQYKNNSTAIDFIQTEEGKAVPQTSGGYDYYYYLGDNLGNTRVTFDTQSGTATALQQDDYYPFGMEISRGTITSPKNEYLYNKKELQEELSEYDYGARFYDPVIARWNVVDAYAEHPDQVDLSPYAYVGNNPVDHTDPDGNCPPCDVSSEGEATGNGGSIIENIVGTAKDAVTSGVFTLGSLFNSATTHTLPMEYSFDYSSGERTMVSSPITTPIGLIGSTVNALLGVSNAIPVGGPAAVVFAEAQGVKTSAATIVKDVTKVENAADVVTHYGRKLDTKTGQPLGPSGKPMVHSPEFATMKKARDAAREGGNGTPVKHTKDAKGGAHYHNGSGVEGKGKDSKNYGKKAGKVSNNVHYQYPMG